MRIDSHIQIPNGILKHFRDESTPQKKVWYLDLELCEISSESSRKLGTKRGYYSKGMEEYLNQKVESPITAFNSRIRKALNDGTQNVSVSEEEIYSFRIYIKSALSRSGLACSTYRDECYSSVLFGDQANHDILVQLGLTQTGPIDKIIESMDMTILVNCTARNLVVPRNCFYTVPTLNSYSLVAPISPNVALVLLPAEHPTYGTNQGVLIESVEEIEQMNRAALKYDYVFNKSFIASASKPELQSLQEYLQLHRTNLEHLRHKTMQ